MYEFDDNVCDPWDTIDDDFGLPDDQWEEMPDDGYYDSVDDEFYDEYDYDGRYDET
jgi:hypothetical protein